MLTLADLIAPFARAGLTWLSRKSLPQTHGSLELPGLSAAVEVIRDRWGIPHLYAQNRHDLFFAQGFVHAQDRLWQMEMNRRTAQGRLSELFGELALDTDRTSRTFGFNRLGKFDWATLTGEMKEILLAYSEGVNAFLNCPSSRLPVEFTLLQHVPDPWKPEDSTAFSRLMIWQLSHAWYSEIVRARLIEAVGPERAAELEIHYPPGNPLSLPQGIEFNRLDPEGKLRQLPGPFLEQGKGSNAWCVARSKTENEHTYLCNDMHLALRLPSIWYELHLNAPGTQLTGVSLPGLPVVMVGHNDRLAWGMTLAFTDCEDLFVEKVDPAAPNRYQFKGEWRQAQVAIEWIKVKGRSEPHREEVLITHHGPIIAGVVGIPEQRLALSSMALRPCAALAGWLELNQARCWDEFVAAMRKIDAPQLNVAYADVEGNIGYWVTGKVPIRGKGRGDVPAPGWNGEYEWAGELPFEEMPHALNPEKGYAVTCNNKIVPDSYPYFLGEVWMNGYRARRIEEVLRSKEKVSPEDFRRLQLDFTSLPGQEFVQRLENLEGDEPDLRLALDRLRAWDGILSPDSVGGAIYEVARYTLVRLLLEPCLGTELTGQVLGKGFHPLLLAAHEFYGHDTVTLLRLLNDPESLWVQQAGGSEVLLREGLRRAVEWLRAKLGPDPDEWKWGRLHQVTFEHPMALRKPLDKVFNRGPFPIGGDTDTPCQTASAIDDTYNNAWSPSVRFIFDLDDLSQSAAIFPPGQSGQLGSPHYDDLIEPWLKGEYHPLLWTRAQVESEAAARLALEPAQ